jgi:hypothetical protein
MRTFRTFAGTAMMVAAVLGAGGCNSDSPSEGNAPVISQLQVQGAQRVSGDTGLVAISFTYADPDADIDRIAFSVTGGGIATNPLDAGQASGVAGVQQAVTLPAAGTDVQFSISVLDRGGNRSNTLDGTFTAP